MNVLGLQWWKKRLSPEKFCLSRYKILSDDPTTPQRPLAQRGYGLCPCLNWPWGPSYGFINERWDCTFKEYRLKSILDKLKLYFLHRHTFVVRARTDEMGCTTTLIDFQHKNLIKDVCDVCKDSPGICLAGTKTEVRLHEFLFVFEQLNHYLQTNEAYAPRELELLVKYLEGQFSLWRECLARHAPGKITFHAIPLMYSPNTHLYTRFNSSHRCVRLDYCENESWDDGTMGVLLKCRYVDFDGKSHGFDRITYAIKQFPGMLDICDLPVFPLQFHRQVNEIREELIKGGTMLLELGETRRFAYEGPVIDSLRGHAESYFSGRSLVEQVAGSKSLGALQKHLFDQTAFPAKKSTDSDERGGSMDVDSEMALICAPCVYGIAGDTYKIFYTRYMRKLKSIPLSQIRLPDKSFNLLSRLVKNAARPGPVVISFHGPSGSGKATAAVAVADESRHPIVEFNTDGWHESNPEADIANAFQKAEETGALLLLKRVDCLLYEKKQSFRRVVSFIHEKISKHNGIVIITSFTRLSPALTVTCDFEFTNSPDRVKSICGDMLKATGLDDPALKTCQTAKENIVNRKFSLRQATHILTQAIAMRSDEEVKKLYEEYVSKIPKEEGLPDNYC